jgi:hypothetical protein
LFVLIFAVGEATADEGTEERQAEANLSKHEQTIT